jgi:photosystem II stability/assembly factor-like uncharacterized protein
MKRLVLIFSLFLFHLSFAQTWQVLPNSPTQTFRHDDLFFINADTGWVVNVNGQVWRTNDGGNTWNQLISQPSSFRCVSFFDSIHGCIGNLGPGNWAPTSDTNPLYTTSDGGKTWYLPKIIGPKPTGICGLNRINDSVIVATGRFEGPVFFARSTDRGNTWYTKNMSAYAGMLIDTYFTSPDTGFVVGGDSSIEGASHSVILYTTDAGTTWTKKITGAAKGNHCWKISHPSKNVFYSSVEELYNNDTLKYFKSTDGGNTWTENVIAGTPYGWSQGVGFVNDTLGWIGGDTYALTTSDGGKTFTKVPSTLLINLNRVRFISDTLAYAVGQRVYKYSKSPVGIPQLTNLSGYSLEQNIPNPFRQSTTITYSITLPENVLIEVFDMGGRKIKTLVNERKPPGIYTVEFSLPMGVTEDLFCAMNAGLYGKRIKMILIK